ncbi:MAG: 50S ribosomal protein L30 [Chloroflexi bacterium]|nr:50S ribosomal protein L30 [Chloroflexota bacterium]
MAGKTLRITMKRSTIGTKQKHRAMLRTLGLKKIGQTVERPDAPDIRGMLVYINHLVEVEEVE